MQLVITEKLSVAESISNVIGATQKQNGYFEGEDYLVSWCMGHLIELAQPENYREQWKKWSYESLPIKPEQWKYVVKKDTKKQYEMLCKLLHDTRVSTVICATDAGREGELIFRLVYDMAGCDKPVKRLWVSSMEESAIRESFKNLQPGSDYNNLYYSALCRQRADWLVGINSTRLFTVLYGGKVLKVGRVQTPTLAMLVERETKIMNFRKEKYYMAHILMDGIDATTGRIDEKEKADEIVRACQDRQALVTSVIKEEKSVAPPKLYDLTTLQRDANRLFGFTAKQTLEYMQSLYEKKLVTYPRTDSQYLSDDMGESAERVINAVFHSILFEESIPFHPSVAGILNSRKVTDHHAIIPTLEVTKVDLSTLPETERKISYLTANRLLCATGSKHLYKTIKVELHCSGYVFVVSGRSVTQNGWKDFESIFLHSFKFIENKEGDDFKEADEKKLSEVTEGMVFEKMQTKVSEHETTPPRHFTEDSLLSAMEHAGTEDMGDDVERKGLGTPATRADIIEKLVRDGFVKRDKKQMIPTEDGIRLITVLPDVIKSPNLTADWENALTLVTKGELAMEDFMTNIENMVSELIHTYHDVSDEQKTMFVQKQEVLGTCPSCDGQVVKGKFGAYCINKCGMNVSRIMGVELTDAQVKDLLAGKKILLKGLKSKAGKPYDAYIIPGGTEEYYYTKSGEEKSGVRFKFIMEFPKKKKK